MDLRENDFFEASSSLAIEFILELAKLAATVCAKAVQMAVVCKCKSVSFTT